MEKSDLQEMTTGELRQKGGTVKVITWTLGIILFILFCMTVYLSFTKGQVQPLLAVPFALSPILFLNIKNLKAINSELATRGFA